MASALVFLQKFEYLVEIWRKFGTKLSSKSLILILAIQILVLLFKFVLQDRVCTIELSYLDFMAFSNKSIYFFSNLDPFWAFLGQNWNFISDIGLLIFITQLFKLGWKMVLFSTLGICMWFWPFWTNFGSIFGQFWANLVQKWPDSTP